LKTSAAVKVLREDLFENRNIRERFLAEARNLAVMTHPHVVKVSDLHETEQYVAFVMEYIEGETLKERIERKGKLSDEEIHTILPQMLEALAYVHDQQLVHRDVKPSNFMIDKAGHVRLMDFGIAKQMDTSSADYTQTGTGMQMGTPMYMSPEQITETKSVTFQADIYSLGVVLWQMVTGMKPYDTKTLNTFQLQTKIVNEPLPATNTAWETLISKATEKTPEERFTSCRDWLNQLRDNKASVSASEDATVFEAAVPIPSPELRNNRPNTPHNEAKGGTTTAGVKKKKWVLPVSIVGGVGLIVGLFFLFSTENNHAKADNEKQEEIAPPQVYEGEEVTIGSQVWMAENLDVAYFQNGDPIPEAKTIEEWEKADANKEPAWCYYDNDPANGKKYGKLYNWYAVNDERGLAPKGWHVPTDNEWTELTDFLGGLEVAGEKMKSTSGWEEHGNGTNESGFNGLPAGRRRGDGKIDYIGRGGDWWSSTEDGTDLAWGRNLINNRGSVDRYDYYKSLGFSVRCLRD
jgi:uncharacterized protein (TIGR02145 family)